MKPIYKAEVKGNRGRGRFCTRWHDGVRKVLSEKDMTIQQNERIVHIGHIKGTHCANIGHILDT